jgi:hypothetical protein
MDNIGSYVDLTSSRLRTSSELSFSCATLGRIGPSAWLLFPSGDNPGFVGKRCAQASVMIYAAVVLSTLASLLSAPPGRFLDPKSR